jgi:hypothetical protein
MADRARIRVTQIAEHHWVALTPAGYVLRSFAQESHARVFAAAFVAARDSDATAEALRLHHEELRRIGIWYGKLIDRLIQRAKERANTSPVIPG